MKLAEPIGNLPKIHESQGYGLLFGSVAFLVLLAGCDSDNPSNDPPPPDPSARVNSDNPTPNRKTAIKTREFSVVHDGVRVNVREKTLRAGRPAQRTLVLLPSASYCTQPNWDLQVGDYSVMDAFASNGWCVVAVDLPGYGQSDDPPDPAQFGAAEATLWLNRVIDQVAEERSIETVDLLGWSWGAQVDGCYAQDFPHRVRRLVLYGFTYAKRIPAEALPPGYLDEPFRKLTREFALSDFVAECHDPSVAEAYAMACLAADDQVPTGPLNDYVHHLPIVDPTRLTMPCLMVCGQYELEPLLGTNSDRREFFASRRRDLESFCQSLPHNESSLVVIPGGGHAVHLEKSADEWRRSVEDFLGRR